jgi:hypothetical protein
MFDVSLNRESGRDVSNKKMLEIFAESRRDESGGSREIGRAHVLMMQPGRRLREEEKPILRLTTSLSNLGAL